MRPGRAGDCTVAPCPTSWPPHRRRPPSRLARLIAAGELSPVEAVSAAIERAAAVQPHLNCFTDVWDDEARQAAEAAAARSSRGDERPRHPPRRTGRGEGHHARRRSPHDARLVRLRALGARSGRLHRHRPAPRRGDHHRPDDDPRVRPHPADRQPALGRHPQPARSPPHPRRFLGWQRGRRRVRLRAPRRGVGHGRLGAHPGGLVRRRRPQAGPRADPDGRPPRPVRHHLAPRPARPQCRRRPPVPRRHPGARRRRHPVRPDPARPLPLPRAGRGRAPPRRSRSTSVAGRSTRRSPPPSSRPPISSPEAERSSSASTCNSRSTTWSPGTCCGACSCPPTSATSSPSSATGWTRRARRSSTPATG